MERLFLHIEYLLRTNNCVIVPSFGAFIKNKLHARYDDSLNIFFPPTEEICFNPSIKNNDGLIAGSYSRKYGLSFNEATKAMHSDIEAVNNLLNSGNEATIKNIGTLTKEEDLILFSPILTSNSIEKRLGFSTLKLGKEEKIESSEIKTSEEANINTRVFDTEKNYYIAINKMFAKISASIIFVVLLATSVILPPLLTDGKKGYETASIVPEHSVKPIEKKEEATPQPTEQISLEKPIETAKEGKYHIIVAAFKTKAMAEKYVSKYDDPGMMIKEKNKTYIISAYNSDNRDKVVELLNSEEFKDKFKKGWILE